MPVILYEGANMHTLSINKARNVRLVPGKNTISEEDLDALNDKKTGSAGFKHLRDNGEITLLDDDAVDTDGDGIILSNMNAKAIQTVIEAEPEVEVLKAYLSEEKDGKNRIGVLKAINLQIESLEEEPEED